MSPDEASDAEAAPEIITLVDQHVGSRVRMRRLMLKLSQNRPRQRHRRDLSTSPEVRERHEPHRRGPLAANRSHSANPGRVLL